LKSITYIILTVALLIAVGIFFRIVGNSKKYISEKTVRPFDIITLSGDTVSFPFEGTSKKSILNFYSSDCSLCTVEIDDIISFSKSHNVVVLFISADSLISIQKFASKLKSQLDKNESRILFGQVSLQDMETLFGDITVPQTIVFDQNFKILGLKKGMVTAKFLQRSFE
jgi:peroxiredoxin